MALKRKRIEHAYEHLTFYRAIVAVIVAGTALVVLEAVLMRIAEPETFTRFPEALWFSVVTVATVGYGDFVPHSDIGRAAASLGIVFGLGWIPIVSSIVVSALVTRVQSERRDAEVELLERMAAQLDELHARLDRSEGRGAP